MKPIFFCEKQTNQNKIRLNETSALINRGFKSPAERESGVPSGSEGPYGPDGPTCGGVANRPTVSVKTNTQTHTDGGLCSAASAELLDIGSSPPSVLLHFHPVTPPLLMFLLSSLLLSPHFSVAACVCDRLRPVLTPSH